MEASPTNARDDGEAALSTTSDTTSNMSETTSLLPGKTPREDSVSSNPDYGSLGSDPEQVQQGAQSTETERRFSNAFIAKTVVALLIGVFTANVDGSLVIATHPVIGSEFNDLENSSWLFIGFMLAGAATQSLYGKLSDIFGRKSLLLACYCLFAIGCALVGVGQSMWQVILGRVISGSGGAGMNMLAILLITDLVPLREVGTWQSYLNVIGTTGRSLGGPLGGWLADTIGWRWSFLGQAPIFVAAAILCWFVLPKLKPTTSEATDNRLSTQLARIDFTGATLLGLGVFSILLPLEIAGSKIPWNHPITIGSFIAGAILIGLFLVTEQRWAREPIFPPRLLRNSNATICYILMGSQMAAQLSMMFSVPLYFQVTQQVSSTVAGAHLFPAVTGNAVGGVVSGFIIKRTGRYKALVIFAAVSSCISYLLLILRWHGHTNWAESMYIIPGGLGTGIAQTSVFIALQASIDPADKVAATSAFFLAGPIATIAGMAVSSALLVGGLRKNLFARLTALGFDDNYIKEVIEKAAADIHYIKQSPPQIANAIVSSYIHGIEYSHIASLVCSALAFVAAIFLRERNLRK